MVRTKAENYEETKGIFASIPKVLFNSDRLAGAKYIYVVEGEKCAVKLQSELDNYAESEHNQGSLRFENGEHIAVTNIHGAGKWRTEYTKQLQELCPKANLIILPDNDEAGKRHARDIWEQTGKKAKVIIPSGLEAKQDVFDWLELGGDILQLLYWADENSIETNQFHDFLQDDYFEKPQNNLAPQEEKIYELNEVGNCERFLDSFGSEFIFVENLGWYYWNKSHWEEDKTASLIKQKIIESIYLLRNYELSIPEEEKGRRAKIHNFYNASMSERKITAILRIAETSPKIFRKSNILNNKKDYLNVQNGVIDLRQGIILPHDKKYYFTKVIPVDYPRINSGLPILAPVWKDFLSTTFMGNTSLIEYIQTMMGYSLTGITKEQCVFFMTGTGRNGKSTFIKVLQQLLGGYYKKLNTDALIEKHNSSPINNDIARLHDSRLVVCSEVEEGKMWNLSLMKDMSGGDEISARFMRQEYFDFLPQFKMWIYGNYKPMLKGLDEGTKRRFRIIPFDAKIEPSKVKKNLDELLTKELSQILAWAVEGAVRYYRTTEKDLQVPIPEVVSIATEEYFLDNDPLHVWLDDYFNNQDDVMFSGDMIDKKTLYKSYKEFADETGAKAFAEKSWSRKMKEHGFVDRVSKDQSRKSIRCFANCDFVRNKFAQKDE